MAARLSEREVFAFEVFKGLLRSHAAMNGNPPINKEIAKKLASDAFILIDIFTDEMDAQREKPLPSHDEVPGA